MTEIVTEPVKIIDKTVFESKIRNREEQSGREKALHW